MANDYYNGDLAWADWANAATQMGNGLVANIDRAYAWYQKWYGLTYGLNVQQILALPGFSGQTAASIQAMQYAFGVFADLYNLMNNVSAPAQGNRVAYLAPFLS